MRKNGQAAPTPTLDRGNDGSDTRRVPERRIATANPSMASTVQQGKIGRKDQTNAFECAKTAWRREEEQHMTRRKQKTGSADKDNRAEVLAVGRLSAPAAAAASRAWRAAHAGKTRKCSSRSDGAKRSRLRRLPNRTAETMGPIRGECPRRGLRPRIQLWHRPPRNRK